MTVNLIILNIYWKIPLLRPGTTIDFISKKQEPVQSLNITEQTQNFFHLQKRKSLSQESFTRN
jgi:hypothetical protein